MRRRRDGSGKVSLTFSTLIRTVRGGKTGERKKNKYKIFRRDKTEKVVTHGMITTNPSTRVEESLF